jgi:hypothetical protein
LLDHAGQRESTRVWEALDHRSQTEPMVTVPMRHIHDGQVLPAACDPVSQTACLADRQEGVDQNHVSLARDQSSEIGDHTRSSAPGGTSVAAVGIEGATWT